MGIPFDFAAKPVVAPAEAAEAHDARPGDARSARRWRSPSRGWRAIASHCRMSGSTATFTDDSRLVLTPEQGRPVPRAAGRHRRRGRGTDDGGAGGGAAERRSAIHLAKHLLYNQFRDPGEPPKMHLFGQIKRVAKRWLDEGYLVCIGGTTPAMVTYLELADQAAELIFLACQPAGAGGRRVKAILDPYKPTGSSRFVNFTTSKPLYTTDPTRCHVNHVVLDSDWEAEFCRVAEAHPRVLRLCEEPGHAVRGAVSQWHAASPLLPDYIVRIDDGGPEPLNLIVEIKGFRGHRRAAQGRDDAQALGAGREQSRHLRPLGVCRVHRRL